MHVLQTELEQRWRAMFVALAGGEDVPPAQRLRAEGMMEAADLLGIATREALLASMGGCYREVNGRSIEEEFGADWQDLFPFPQIPAMAKRAPVFPSTTD
jgi:hypothetical protein